ncbi:glycolipid 2-alpha-mannosyltransferase-domain-containing protein [Mycotypha africana]|uniref:glycolipid 2-alpha-mannosyltransferase-domain-containing protein n=1 Tax=Mycotypha africana TaxID=64632 RepID=UPI0023000026|nr:glycolipid 2-alpha-mannosyltransferase-domain-containing protein [Mycotypha africana]KAI8991867.1 glycolipid 2-alpha-mannosyltransferase-domain-containing protein [Mycotypha africana]
MSLIQHLHPKSLYKTLLVQRSWKLFFHTSSFQRGHYLSLVEAIEKRAADITSAQKRQTWTKEETETLKELVKKHGPRWTMFSECYFPSRRADYIRKHYYTSQGFTRWTPEEKETLARHLQDITDLGQIDWSTLENKFTSKARSQVRARCKELLSRKASQRSGRWTVDEVNQLCELVKNYPDDWHAVSQKLQRSVKQCKNKWSYENRNAIITTGKFSDEEDKAILKAVETFGATDFYKIKQATGSSRTVMQIRDRYESFINPALDRSPWSEEEKQQLFDLYTKYRNVSAVKKRMDTKRQKNGITPSFINGKAAELLNRESIGNDGVQMHFSEEQLDNEHLGLENLLDIEDTTAKSSPKKDLQVPENREETKPIVEKLPNTKQIGRENAVIVILVRNREIQQMRRTLRQFEDRFNRKYKYPYVFLNDEPFSNEFKFAITSMTEADVKFGLVPSEMWSIPKHVNGTVMQQQLDDYAARHILYGGSLSYRHMCRFNSGFFYRHPLVADYDYYWRVEPGVEFYCDLDYDPFTFMRENGKEYGFTITLKEIPETIPTLWDHTMKFAHEHDLNTTLLKFFGNPQEGYNLCHFWSNFEIASLNLWRDERYQAYFDYLDSTGNFFYERWGDAIVHSLAAGLFLNKNQVHFFNDIGYKHDSFAHCVDDGLFGKCMCPYDTPNFDNDPGSCLDQWKSYPEKGYRWDFRSNGEQHIWPVN